MFETHTGLWHNQLTTVSDQIKYYFGKENEEKMLTFKEKKKKKEPSIFTMQHATLTQISYNVYLKYKCQLSMKTNF